MRGRMLLKDLYELNSVQHVKVGRTSIGQPVRSKARLLVGYLCIIARNANLLPINYESWHHMPDSNKNQALDNIKKMPRRRERFALEVLDNYVKKALGKKWRGHKSALKKEYFKKNISLKEKLRNILPGMLRYQWEYAVRFWNLKKGEVLRTFKLLRNISIYSIHYIRNNNFIMWDHERVGTTSRQKQKFTHTVGSKSFACVAEAEELSPGQKVRRLQLFDITHRKKDGFPKTTEAAEIMAYLLNKI
ncbi:hypothetical protein GOBAR_AA01541 [Gossypium barbadense]|uniref:Transposase n=1 Tax=Gossypium barbadense TaxID=3634 RepID=A0A2P5YTX4_GOSBA|nr:hypothetical protein GOBAR_AA01541 [Gossypium barbadense]